MMGGLRFFSMDSSVSSGQKYENIDSLSDFAVLCRTSRQMEAFEKAFNDHSIPFQRTGEEPWIKAEPFKSIIYILKDIYLPENPVVKEFLQEKEIQYPPNLEKENNPEFIIRNLAKQLKTDVTWYHMERIIKEMKAYDTVEDFLEAVMLGVPADYHIDKAEKVSMMTIHASKGLEFRCVFVVGLEDGLLPYSLFESRVADVKEEERLLYVAMTRSREYLYLTHATRRVLTGRTYSLPRSHFLHRIDNELVKREKQEHRKKPKKDDSQLALF
jgi:superfamily I DNA/RNA helicase